jgi:hypothetical protein
MKKGTCSVHYMAQSVPRQVLVIRLHRNKASHTQHLLGKQNTVNECKKPKSVLYTLCYKDINGAYAYLSTLNQNLK